MLTKFQYALIPAITVLLLMAGNSHAAALKQDAPGPRRVVSDKGLKWQTRAKNWYIRLRVEAPEHGFVDNSTLLGQIKQPDAAIQYSLINLAPSGGDYLYVTFVNPKGVDDSGEYQTSFHPRTKQTRKQDSWGFTVKSSDPDNDIIIGWSGLFVLESYTDEGGRTRFHEHPVKGHRLSERMKLVDSLTFEEVPMTVNNELQSYSFNMEGMNERNFTWILERSNQRKSPVKGYSPVEAREKLVEMRSNAKGVRKYLKQLRMTNFDLKKPPLNEEME